MSQWWGRAGAMLVRTLRTLLLGWVLGGTMNAQAAPPRPALDEMGRLFHRTFGSAELGADPQNWAVAQDGSGRVYAGNSLGLLEYDGVRWRLMPTRKGTTPRALAADAKGVVYYGAQGEFGWVETDGAGQRRLMALEDRLPAEARDFSQIWSVGVTSEGVYFSAKEWLFRWDGQRLRSWRPKGTFFSGYTVGDRYLILDNGQGLMELKQGELTLLPGGEAFRNERPRFITQGLGGSLLWGSRAQGLMAFDQGRIRVFPSPANPYLVAHLLYSGTVLRDGTLVLGTIQGGVVILDADGRVLRTVSREAGLGDPTVYALHEGARGGVWLGQSTGVTYLEWPGRYSHFDAATGLDGVVVAVHRHGGKLYASTQRGLFVLVPGAEPRFRAIQGVQGQCWDLLSVGDRLLVANFNGLYEVRGEAARKLPAALGHTLALLRCPWDARKLMAGTDHGLFMVDLETPTQAPQGPLGGWMEVVQTLAPTPEGGVWVGCDAPLSFGVTRGPAGEPAAERFGPELGLPTEAWFNAVRLPEGPVLLSGAGIFHRTVQGRFERMPGTAALNLEGVPWYRVAPAAGGGLWVGFQRPGNLLRHAHRTAEGGYAWDTDPAFSFQGSQVYALYAEADGVTWFGGVEGLLRREGRVGDEPPAPPAPSLRLLRLQVEDGAVPWVGTGTHRLAFRDRDVRFEFALPRGAQAYVPRYQVRLEGRDSEWSPWSTEAYRDYPGLMEGSYRFHVRAQAGAGGVPSESTLAFRILPPWYRTLWAYGAYAVILVGFLLALHRLRMRVLERRAEGLAQQVEVATQELMAANHSLQEVNEQKSRLMAVVTHDLRNPLHGIALAAENLQHLEAPEAVARVARRIELESQEMGALVSRFLDLAAWESQGGRPRLEPVDLREALHGALGRHDLQAQAKRIRICLAGAEAPLRVRAEPRWVGSVLDNLLSNALKFSPPDSTIQVEVTGGAEWARVRVRDEGPGFTDVDRAELFTRYARLSARPTGGEASLGLGLALTRELVAALGGRLELEPGAGPGATFRVELPRA